MKKKDLIAEIKQYHEENQRQFIEIARLNDLVMGYDSRNETQAESIRTLQKENKVLDVLNNALVGTAEQNRLEIISLKKQLHDQKAENEKLKTECFGGVDFDSISKCLIKIAELRDENKKLKAQIESATDFWKGELRRHKVGIHNQLFSAWCDGFIAAELSKKRFWRIFK